MTAIVAKMPSVAKTVLDQNVVPSDTKPDAPRFHIKYNFKWFSHPAEDALVNKVEDCLPLQTKPKLPPEKIFVPVLNVSV
ncbi:unnamed protein product [Allacma fusca]|uniref:Uncharacterized protein n=1 Tax=Allacma fusca TaxID=39272 RepID=A0A8J2KDY1_9HEXA|nr:unnamed protein product [Allacma fusca]